MRFFLSFALILGACASTAKPPVRPAPPPPPPPPPLVTDLVSPIAAAGIDHAQGLDWAPDEATKSASEVFKNAQLLGTLPAERLMTAMQSMAGNLGVDCQHCHAREFESDDKKPKVTARKMMKMAYEIDQKFFQGHSNVTCYTCHRRDATPDKFTPTKPPPVWPLPPLAAGQANQPARMVFTNLHVLGDLPAGRWQQMMTMFANSLGVDCTYCHVKDLWAADTDAKRRAREMLTMVRSLGDTYFPGEKNPVHCSTCHRGHTRPPRTAGPMLKVVASLPGGGPAPRAILVLGPPTFNPATRGALRQAVRADASSFMPAHLVAASEGEIGHVPPGAYSLCALSLPQDPDPANDPRGADRPVACAPVTVTAKPDVQTVKRDLLPL